MQVMDDMEQYFQKEQDQMSMSDISVEIFHFSQKLPSQPPLTCPKFTKSMILKQH